MEMVITTNLVGTVNFDKLYLPNNWINLSVNFWKIVYIYAKSLKRLNIIFSVIG